MPCNSDYMNPNDWEIEMSKVACLLDELNGLTFNKNKFGGYHPRVYTKSISKELGDKWVEKLCSKLQKEDVTKYSLEMQLWWRDHQAADKKRLKEERAQIKDKKKKEEALAKLTPYERKLLGL